MTEAQLHEAKKIEDELYCLYEQRRLWQAAEDFTGDLQVACVLNNFLKTVNVAAGTLDFPAIRMGALDTLTARIKENEDALAALGTQQYTEVIQELLEAIPKQDENRDWWPDELTHAVKKAKELIDYE